VLLVLVVGGSVVVVVVVGVTVVVVGVTVVVVVLVVGGAAVVDGATLDVVDADSVVASPHAARVNAVKIAHAISRRWRPGYTAEG
jgi:hypothetical protein